MSQRRATAVAQLSDKRRPAPSSASIISSAAGSSSSASNLLPFEGLSPSEAAFIDAIIRRVPPHVTNFVPVFKAYQDEFEARGQNATDDQFYYNLLLKLGMIRAENWSEQWRVVCEHWGYAVSSPQQFIGEEEMSEDLDTGGVLHEVTPKQREIIRQVDYDVGDGEDDAFTLHSGAESLQYPTDIVQQPPPSYYAKQPVKPTETRTSRENPTERIASSSTLSRAGTGLSSGINGGRRVSSITVHDGKKYTPQEEEEVPSPIAAVPPSYHTNPRVRRNSALASDQVVVSNQEERNVPIRDDTETWRIIQMERDADMFRREFLLSCCLDVWIKGLRWVEETSTQLDNARTAFLLQSVLTRWRSKARAAIEETKRAGMVDRVRLMSSTLRTWRMRAWTERRKRWAEGMRAKMVQMQGNVHRRVLGEFFLKWKRVHQLTSASRHHDLVLLHSALRKWNRRLYRIVDLSQRGEELTKHADSVILERAFGTWKRRVHFNVASKIIQERVGERVVSNALVLWRQKTHIYSVASGFNDARILRDAMQKWIRRRARIQYLERRAIAHQNKPLVRAVLRIWLIQARLQRYESLRRQRQKANALRVWIERVHANRAKENLAMQFSGKVDKHLASQILSIWGNRLARRKKLERRAQRAFEATMKAKALIQWRSVMWAHAKQVKQAKLARRLFLTRLAWKRWRDVVEARRWEQSRLRIEKKVLRRTFDAWKERARIQKGLRRKGEVVQMAAETRLVKEALQAWTLRVVYLKDREYSVIQENKERVLRACLAQWKKKLNQQQENTSLMVSFQDVRREENMRQVLNHWLQATRRKRSLAEREEELNRAVLSQAYDRWRDRFLENNLRPAELDVLVQSQTNLLFKMFRIWEARTPSIPAIRFHAHHTRANAWRKWKAAMPAAMKRKEARDHDRFVLLAKSLERWRERYKTKVSLKAVARARYLRLPPAPAKQAASRMLLIKPRNSTSTSAARSYRSASPERELVSRPLSIGARPAGPGRAESIQAPARAESSRAPSPTSTRASFQGFGLAGLAKRRPVFGVPSSSGVGGGGGGSDERKGPGSVDARSRSSWDGYGATRARARAAFAAGARPSSVYQESRGDESD